MSKQSVYPAKLLLFGEHTVLKGSSSLAMPFDRYGMYWQKKDETVEDREHQTWLKNYAAYLKIHCNSFLDIDQLFEHLRKHTIVADIPIGYGLGSSGALTAAIYAISSIDVKLLDISELQNQLGLMESFFHGKSSGFDPLVAYINKSLKKTNDQIDIIEKNRMSIPNHCYLLDSGHPRSGKGMIEQFLNRWPGFEEAMSTLCYANDEAINIILGSATKSFDLIVKQISTIQLACMDYMIVPTLLEWWKAGLASDEYYLKVCGAGGGGYYLVFSKTELQNVGPFQLEKVTL